MGARATKFSIQTNKQKKKVFQQLKTELISKAAALRERREQAGCFGVNSRGSSSPRVEIDRV